MNLIFYNGKIVTMDPDLPIAEAVSVKDGGVEAVGAKEPVLAGKTAQSELIDLKGRMLLPGFNDSHMHLTNYALTLSKVDLRFCEDINDLVNKIKAFIRQHEPGRGEWVLGWGWNHSKYGEGRMPDRDDLDKATIDSPLVIVRTCCHIAVANTRALELAGLDQAARAIEGGEVETDRSGRPNGILKESAMQLVMDLIPPADKNNMKDLIKTAGRDFLSAGLTSVQTDDLYALGSEKLEELLDAYQELENEGNMPLRVNFQPQLMSMDRLKAFLELGKTTGWGSDYFRIGPLKLFTDGSMGGRTALLSSPYNDDPENCGVPVLPRESFYELVCLGHREGMQVACHAIGDAAINMVLDAYSHAQSLYPRTDPRFRVVHASLADPASLERFRELNVIADIQPSFIASDYDLLEKIFGAERAGWAYRWQDFIEAGIHLAGSSDCPVENYHPLEGIAVAVTRQDLEGRPEGGWFPDQRLSLDQALQLYTTGSAYCTYEEDRKGSISPGKLADLVVLAEDIYKVAPLEISSIPVDMTVVGGEIKFIR